MAITITLGNDISLDLLENSLCLKNNIEKECFPWVLDLVTSYCSVSVFVGKEFYQNHSSLEHFFKIFCESIIFENQPIENHRIIEIPMVYDGIDLDFVCKQTNLSKTEFIEIHSKPVYSVAMIGFLPGFPYLLGMDERLFVPRKSNPRKIVNKGSVAIAGKQTGIYPMPSPGGWQIIGNTEVNLFSISDLSLLKIGDNVKFLPN